MEARSHLADMVSLTYNSVGAEEGPGIAVGVCGIAGVPEGASRSHQGMCNFA